jgi:hypothetical protein
MLLNELKHSRSSRNQVMLFILYTLSTFDARRVQTSKIDVCTIVMVTSTATRDRGQSSRDGDYGNDQKHEKIEDFRGILITFPPENSG